MALLFCKRKAQFLGVITIMIKVMMKEMLLWSTCFTRLPETGGGGLLLLVNTQKDYQRSRPAAQARRQRRRVV